MKWKWCHGNGKTSKVETNFQKDKVGNILQITGAVNAKACQNCGSTFNTKVNTDEVRQNVSKYECKDCKFKSLNPQEAIHHNILKKEHNMKIKDDSQVVGYRKTLSDYPIVRFTEDDCIILCTKCNDIN